MDCNPGRISGFETSGKMVFYFPDNEVNGTPVCMELSRMMV